MHRGKVDPGVSELPRGNELSRDHVNRPSDVEQEAINELDSDDENDEIIDIWWFTVGLLVKLT